MCEVCRTLWLAVLLSAVSHAPTHRRFAVLECDDVCDPEDFAPPHVPEATPNITYGKRRSYTFSTKQGACGINPRTGMEMCQAWCDDTFPTDPITGARVCTYALPNPAHVFGNGEWS